MEVEVTMVVEVGTAVGVTRQEQAEDTQDARPPQLETKVGRGPAASEGIAVNVGQKAETFEIWPIIWRRQLSWLQLGAVASARFSSTRAARALGLDAFGQRRRSKARVPRMLTKWLPMYLCPAGISVAGRERTSSQMPEAAPASTVWPSL